MTEYPIRILHVSGRMDKGGVECRNMEIYREIDRSKIQYDFLTHVDYKCFFDDEIESLGGHVYHLPRPSLFNYFSYKKAVDDFFSDHSEYNIILGHMTSTGFIYQKIAKKHGVPIRVAYARSSGPVKIRDFTFKDIAKKLSNLLLRHYITHKFAISKPAAKNVFGERSVTKGEVKIIPNAVNARLYTYNKDKRDEVRKNLNIPSDTFLIGHVGRFEKLKNHDFLIDIFKELCDTKSKVKLMLVGGYGDLRNHIEEKSKALNIYDKILFMGVRDDVPELMQAMDLFLFPSLYEGFPGAVLEAQAAGLPCLVSNNVTDEVNVTGLVEFLPLSKGAKFWSEKIIDIVCGGFEREDTYKRIVDKSYDVESMARWYENFYLDVSKGVASRRGEVANES